MGVYSTSQFLGAALGGIFGGWLFSLGGASIVFAGCAALAALWLFFAANMQEPPYVTSLRLPVSPAALQATQWLTALRSQAGVMRSEERRVGKECRSGWSRSHYKNVGPGHGIQVLLLM